MNARIFKTAACALGLLSGALASWAASVSGEGEKFPAGYVPPLLANGDVSLLLDYSGGMFNREYCGLFPKIFRAGRRAPLPSVTLFEQGKVRPELVLAGEAQRWPVRWTQELDVRGARTVIEGTYAHGVTVRTEAFVCEDAPVLAIRRTLANGGDKSVDVTSGYSFEAPKGPRVRGDWETPRDGACDYAYTFFGSEVIDGRTRFLLRGESAPAWKTTHAGRVGALTETFALAPGARRVQTAYFAFADTRETKEPANGAKLDAQTRRADELGFDGLFAAHRAAWSAYWAESSVRVPDAALQRMYDVAQYHLKCNATRWSFPTGIFDTHWQGKYFGFDEMYAHQGLASSGHFELARRCPEFRFATLRTAKMRCGHYGPDRGRYGARWLWESIEDGLNESAPSGFWLDHIFNQGTIARTAWTQYLFTGDRAWLESRGYPVIRECARFFAANWVYEGADGHAYIGKCTDLERLGPARDRPFMTTCGAVYALRAAADAADVLGKDAEEAVGFRRTADRLLAGLPVADGRYVPFVGAKEVSVAMLGGLYPFPVFGATNELQNAAARHFIANGRKGGNMYPFGKGTCPWYAGKMSIAMALLGDRVEPAKWLNEAALEQGLFGETFEINEPGYTVHPWFATASGCVTEALNTMLLASFAGEVRVGCAVPASWTDYAFRLPAYGGITVDCEVAGGKLVRLDVRSRTGAPRKVRLVLPDGTRREIVR